MSFEQLETHVSLLRTQSGFGMAKQILVRLFTNVLTSPQEEKFRKIALSNKRIREDLLSLDGALDFLLLVGWTKDETQENVVLASDASLEPLQKAVSVLNAKPRAAPTGPAGLDIEGLCDALSSFTGQGICGVQMACFRGQGIKHTEMLEVKKGLFAHYLNQTWKSLILRDDEFITNTFNAIHAFIPNESPLCLIHKIFQIGCICLLEPVMMGSSTPAAQQIPSNQPYVDTLRSILLASYGASSRQLFVRFYTAPEAATHVCTGPKLQNLHQEDPNEVIFKVERR